MGWERKNYFILKRFHFHFRVHEVSTNLTGLSSIITRFAALHIEAPWSMCASSALSHTAHKGVGGRHEEARKIRRQIIIPISSIYLPAKETSRAAPHTPPQNNHLGGKEHARV